MKQMTSYTADHAAIVGRSSSISVLHRRRVAQIDPEPVSEIFATKEQVDAEHLICGVLEDIAFRLDVLEQARMSHTFMAVSEPARRLANVARQIGLTEVATAALHLTNAAVQEDGVALNAIMARLEQAFDVAVTEIWKYRRGV